MKFTFLNKTKNKKSISSKEDDKSAMSKKYTTMEDVENYYQQYSHYDLSKIIKFFKR